jgi:AAHS family 4-hydroxybenzoate transporter-like MFS transporter
VSASYDVDRLVDDQKIDRFNLQVVGLSFLAMLADGYEITAMAFAAPELVRLWDIDASALGVVFSASLFGILFGAPLLGFVGDRYGRRVAIITGCIVCGVSTLSMVFAANLEQMFVMRFFAGIGIGGLMPNTISLTSELSPRRHRAMMIVLMFVGITIGSGSPSVIAAQFVPVHGWQVLFLIGGVTPLVVAVILAVLLPESIKFLVARGKRDAALLRVARRMRRDIAIPDDATFTMHVIEGREAAGGLGQMFSGGLQFITPLIWFCFASTLMANFFLNSWMPVLFERSGMSPEDAALASGLYHVGGTIGGLLISVLIDRFGVFVIAVFLGVAAPTVAAIGIESLPELAVLALSLVAGIGVLGAQFGNNASAGLIYPTEIRAKAVGFAFSIGRFGSILGPLLGGYVISQNVSLPQMFQVAALPLVLGMVAAIALTRLCWVRYDGFQLDDKPAGENVGAEPARESA